MKKKGKLTARERDLLSFWKAEGESNKECGRRLGRDPSTIGRELTRNSYRSNGQSFYVAIHAQARADEREARAAHGKQELKNPDVYDYVVRHLRMGWSPDSIAGRLRKKHPKDRHWWITAETIYRWIYRPKQIKGAWFEYLRRKQKKRRKQKGRKVQRAQIPDRVSIHLRPEWINQRKVFGHWEGDSLEGKGHKDGAHVEVERVSRKVAGKLVKAIDSKEALKAQKKIFGKLPKVARKSTTLDNGRENHLHQQLKRKLKMKTYFTDPYSAWQKGSVEHGNWLLRYYFPKGTDFREVSEEEFQEAIKEVNQRPRKILDYQTPNEVFNKLVV